MAGGNYLHTTPVRLTLRFRFGAWKRFGVSNCLEWMGDIKTESGETGSGCSPGHARTFRETYNVGPLKIARGPALGFGGVRLSWLLACAVIAAAAFLLRR